MFAQLHGNVDHQPAPSVYVVLPGFRQQTGDEAVKIFIELLSTHTHAHARLTALFPGLPAINILFNYSIATRVLC